MWLVCVCSWQKLALSMVDAGQAPDEGQRYLALPYRAHQMARYLPSCSCLQRLLQGMQVRGAAWRGRRPACEMGEAKAIITRVYGHAYPSHQPMPRVIGFQLADILY